LSGQWGLTSVGWLSKPLDVISDEIDAGLRKILGDSAGTEPDGSIPLRSMAGQLKVLLVDGFGGQWDKLQAVVSALDPSQAVDSAQDVLCSITATVREAAEFSVAIGTCTGAPLTALPVGRVATVGVGGARFDSQQAIDAADPNFPSSTIAALPAWAVATNYKLGDRVTANGNAYQCVVAGASAGAGTGPAGTVRGIPIVDGGATWNFLGVGIGAVDVKFIAEVAGTVRALANSLTEIATPINGWTGITNVIDAGLGQLQESNAALRLRRDAELAAPGNSTPDAIRARILAVNQGSLDANHQPPTSVKVLFNDKDVPDADGLPPHSVEVIVAGGTDEDIALAIWNCVAAGTATYSGTGHSTTVIDAQGNQQIVNWTRPVAVPIYVVATVYYDASKWPLVGAPALVEQAALSALLTFGDSYPVGQSVRALPLGAAIVDGPSQVDSAGVAVVPAPAGSSAAPGLLDVSPLNIGTAPAPGTSAPVTIGVREFAQFNSANITLTAVAEAP
jgi:hypothetical protein